MYLPWRTAESFQTAARDSPGFSGPKEKVFGFEVAAPPAVPTPCQFRVALGQHPDRPVGVRQPFLRVADREGDRRVLALAAGDREGHGQRRQRLLAFVLHRQVEQRGLAEDLFGRERRVGEPDRVGAFGLVRVRRFTAAASG